MTNHTTDKSRFESPTFEEERSKPMRKGLFSITCAALVVAASATLSWSQTIGGTGTAPRYAKEIFIGDRDPTLNLNGKTVTLVYNPTNTPIAASREADMTFTLSAGTFVDPPNLLAFAGAPSDAVTITTGSGGTGAQQITYRIRTTAALTGSGATFTFTVPRITGVGTVLGASTPESPAVSIGVSVAPSVPGQPQGFPVFPATTTPAADTRHTVAISTQAIVQQTLVPASGATSTAPVIDITDRTMLETVADKTVEVTVPAGTRRAILLSQMRVSQDTRPTQQDGTTAFLAVANYPYGNIIVTARGSFSEGDVLFFSADSTYAAAEALSVNTDAGTATFTQPLNGAGAFSISSGSFSLYYLPAAGEMIRQGLISVSYMIDLTLSNYEYADRTLTPGPTRITFDGISDMAYAYAIPSPAVADEGNLRIRCQGEQNCTVFVECRDSEGARIGNGDLAEITIPGYGVRHYSSKTTLPTLLGVTSWTGRISCNVMSVNNSDVSVQLLVRSGGSLVNNTYISGLDPNP